MVGGGLAAWGAPGALALVLLGLALLGAVYVVGQVHAARTGATYQGPLLEHVADVGAAWSPPLDSGRLWGFAAGTLTVVLWGAGTLVLLVVRARRDGPGTCAGPAPASWCGPD